MTRLRGRAPRNRRLLARCPQGHWHTTTMLSALRLDGATTCMTIEGATDAAVFQAYLREMLVPTLKPGDLVVMDNLAAHKTEQAVALIEAAGAKALFLPAYSPDLNPIEMMWSKLKARLRKAEARTSADLQAAIGAALRAVSAQDAAHWFAACGYSII